MIIFTEKKRNEDKYTYTIGDTAKETKKEVKFLGLWLDEELNFRKQVAEVVAKVRKTIDFMKYVMGIK